MKFYITNTRMEMTHDTFNTIQSGNMHVPRPPELNVELTITDFTSDEVKDIESIQNALTGKRYDWITDEELDDIVKLHYPERFI